MYPPPPELPTEVFTEMPQRYRKSGSSTWAEHNKRGAELHSFLEGPSFDREGNLYVVDIPWGRVFRISPKGDWDLVTEYDGWPNGLKIHKDGRIFITDYKIGVVNLDPATGKITPVLTHVGSEGLKGVNDLVFAYNGDTYFTDQGQTGLQDPTGRVYRLRPNGHLDCLIDTVPSPNGLVLNLDESRLLLAASRSNAVWMLPLHPDGGTSKVSLFVQMSGGGGPDGFALDSEGSLAVCHAGLGTVWIFSRMGEPLWRVRSCRGVSTTNLAYGGADMRSLFITESESGSILRTSVPVPGKPMYSHLD